MKITKLYIAFALSLLFVSCESRLGTWNDDAARLYFGGDTTQSKTFVFDPVTIVSDTIFLEVNTIGNTSKKERAFIIRQVMIKDAENAVEGVHFMALNSAEMTKHLIIKANESVTQVPIIIYRDPSLKDKSLVAQFEIVENNHFQLGILKNITRKLYISDTYEMPSRWAWNNYWYNLVFGEYSKVKHEFMYKCLLLLPETNYVPDNHFLLEIHDLSSHDYYATFFQKQLNAYNQEHPDAPLTSEPILPDYPNGKPISFN